MRKITYFLAAVLLLFAWNAQAQQSAVIIDGVGQIVDDSAVAKVGDTAPDFTVQMVDGTSVNVSDLRGKVVLINFWATWCPPCRAEFVRIPQEIVEQFRNEDFVLLAISREEPLETVLKFRKETGYTFPMGIDPDRSIYAKFALNSVPRNYLINKEGKIVMAEIGYTPKGFDKLIAKIKEEVAK